ncbi:bifunctional ligase/repressor BirA [Clostridia bacterium]|nr:bifunctional ligase/repressor BirA [Clostridia bacterium]
MMRQISLPIKGKWVGHYCEWYSLIDSTNVRACQMAKEKIPAGAVVWARQQESGKGRRGGVWFDSPDESLLFSLLIYPEFSFEIAPLFGVLVSTAVSKGIWSSTGVYTQIKWPNDLYSQGKKVCGILNQAQIRGNQWESFVIGVGLNINNRTFPENLDQNATSLGQISGKVYDVQNVLIYILQEIEQLYQRCLESSVQELRQEYESQMLWKGQTIQVIEKTNIFSATLLGISERANARVKLENGIEKELNSGEVSIRGNEVCR